MKISRLQLCTLFLGLVSFFFVIIGLTHLEKKDRITNNVIHPPLQTYIRSRREHESTTQSVNQPLRKFLAILCLERSGSTWFTEMLNKNTGVKIIAEPIVHLAVSSRINPNKTLAAEIELNELILKVDEVIMNSSSLLIGFNEKLLTPKFALPSQYLQLKKLASFLQVHDFKMIILVRKNLLQQAISMVRATQLAAACGDAGWSRVKQPGWEAICGEHLKRISSSSIPIETLKDNIEFVFRNTKQLLETAVTLNIPHIVIYYEDLWLHTQQMINEVAVWLGYKLSAQDTIFIKQSEVSMTAIPNIKDIELFLRGYNPCLLEHIGNSNPPLSCLSTQTGLRSR